METKPFHNAPEIEFKPKFIERYSKLTDWEAFKQCSLSFLQRSIRVNTLKMPVDALKKRLEKKRNDRITNSIRCMISVC